MFEELICPRNEVLPVRAVRVSPVMLAPGKLSVEQTHVDCRHLLRLVVVGLAEVFCTQKPEHRTGGNRSHIAALLIQPLRVASLGHAVTDKSQARCTKSDELVCINGNVTGI